VAHVDVSMHTPSTPLTWQFGAGAPELELLELVLEELELLELLPVELEVLELELLAVGVQHSSLTGPGQWPGVEA
jgi:hypothetical protein